MVTLDRGMGLLQATATNIIGMVGVGPFLTIPFMVSAMGGPHIIYAWAFGALFILQLVALAWVVLSPGRPMAVEHLAVAD